MSTPDPTVYTTAADVPAELTNSNDVTSDLAASIELEAREGSGATTSEPEVKLRTLADMFKLEKEDSRHRMGNYLWMLQRVYLDTPDRKVSFFTWVDGISLKQFRETIMTGIPSLKTKPLPYWYEELEKFQKGVKYASEDQRLKYHVQIQGGRLYRRGRTSPTTGEWLDTKGVVPYGTGDSSSHWSGGGWGIWVLSKSGEFYANRMKVGRFQHSSLVAGKKVMSAGEWQVENGTLKRINARSGHYTPGLEHLLSTLRALRQKHVALAALDVDVYDKSSFTPVKVSFKADALLNMANAVLRYKADPNSA